MSILLHRVCVECGVRFEWENRGGMVKKYCSLRCQQKPYARKRNAYRREVRRFEREEQGQDESPPVWDGVTQYHDTPQLYWFRMYCVCCGDHTWLRNTRAYVAAMRALSPCQVCGGARWIEDDFNPQASKMLLPFFSDNWRPLEAAV